jgi:hypothetical protein
LGEFDLAVEGRLASCASLNHIWQSKAQLAKALSPILVTVKGTSNLERFEQHMNAPVPISVRPDTGRSTVKRFLHE